MTKAERHRAAVRKCERARYRADADFRARKCAAAKASRAAKCASEPGYARLVCVRGCISRVRAQLEAHLAGLEAKRARIGALEKKLFGLLGERAKLEEARKTEIGRGGDL